MDPRLLDYYNRELAYLRELGAEFSRQHPKIAGRLGMSGIEVADPYVERLLEGFAFLSGRGPAGPQPDGRRCDRSFSNPSSYPSSCPHRSRAGDRVRVQNLP